MSPAVFGLAAALAKHRTHHSAAGVFLRRADRFFSGRGALGRGHAKRPRRCRPDARIMRQCHPHAHHAGLLYSFAAGGAGNALDTDNLAGLVDILAVRQKKLVEWYAPLRLLLSGGGSQVSLHY